MIKLAYLALIIGFFIQFFMFLKGFKKEYYKKREKYSSLFSFIHCTSCGVVDIIVHMGAGLVGIDIFLIK